ncbi:MAG TPA: VWA domain-containing protein [Candidatus Limnocylindrales bacterium]|nr:VWA domain-containing protein [Candidatus Limnocylindrales bacterium]
MHDAAVVRSPFRPEVDGRRLLGEAVGFGRSLRAARLSIDLGASVDFARALTLVDIADREQVKAAGAAVFVRRRDDRVIYDAAFDAWWRRRASRLPSDSGPSPLRREEEAGGEETAPGATPPEAGSERSAMRPEEAGTPIPSDGEDTDDESPIEGVIVSPDAYSRGEVLRHREFDRMTPAELREAERLVDLLVPQLERRRTRRYELHSHGRRLAPRAMFRRNLGTGGQLLSWVWRRQVREPRSLVVLCDISGSMERHSRLLLRFIQALSAASEVRTESFVFGTRLTRVTRLLRDRDRDRALARVADSVNDWAGGTRIGDSFRTFNQRWARRSLRTSGVVIVVSDGWDRGDPALVAAETARLRRNCHRLVWLNPLAGTPGYQPLAGGMRAAYPYIDDFLAAGTVASLERLGEILGGVRAGDTRRGSEAAAHAAIPADGAANATRLPVGGPPAVVGGEPIDRSAPRPLR